MKSIITILFLLFVLAGCGNNTGIPGSQENLRLLYNLQSLGAIPYPQDNTFNRERVLLGKLLFFDPVLSGEKDIACASCHHPDFAFTDHRQFAAGTSGTGIGPGRTISVSAITGESISLTPRNTPTIFNASFNADESGLPSVRGFQFADGRARGLESQVVKPLSNRIEMRGDAYPGTDSQAASATLDSVLNRLRKIPEYELLFQKAFAANDAGPDYNTANSMIDSSTFVRAIAAYERELVTRNSPFDRYVKGDDNSLTPTQKFGLTLFYTKAKCATCHDGPMFSNFRFSVQGVPQAEDKDDLGREDHTQNPNHRYAFRIPSLRNVELTPPYMHNGVFETLEEVMRFYNNKHQPRHPKVSDDMLNSVSAAPLDLSNKEIDALVDFLRSLSDPGTALAPGLLTVPERVPSGLTPVVGVAG